LLILHQQSATWFFKKSLYSQGFFVSSVSFQRNPDFLEDFSGVEHLSKEILTMERILVKAMGFDAKSFRSSGFKGIDCPLDTESHTLMRIFP
jgi:hypothetical protein